MTDPKPSRRGRVRFPGYAADPIAEAMETDSVKVADDLESALSDLGSVTDSSVKIVVYRVAPKGDWEHVKQLSPPLKVGELINDVEDTYGAGKYAVRILADGRIKTTKFFSIAAPKDGRGSLFSGPDGLSAASLLKMILERDGKSSGGSDLMVLMMKMQQDSATAMMQMQQQSTAQLMSLMATIMSGRADPADQFLKTIETVKALQGPQNTAKDMLETFSMIREVAGDGGGSSGLMGLAEKFLPAMATLADAARNAPGAVPPGPPVAALPPPEASPYRAPPPAVPGAASGAAGGPPAAGPGAAAPGGGAPASTHPILGLIQPEIEFFMHRGHDPDLAAEAIADVLKARGVTAESLFAFGLEIQGIDGNYIGRLQQLGLDVAGHSAWFESMLACLADIYSAPDDGAEPDAEPEPAGAQLAPDLQPPANRLGANGRGTDPSPDASASAPRQPANKDKKPGRPPH